MNLKAERVYQIVNNDDIFQFTIGDDSEVFDEESVVSFHAVLPMQCSMDRFIFFVEIIDDWFSVVLCPGSKYIDCIERGHLFKELQAIRPYIELKLVSFEIELHVGLFAGENGVNKRLIQVHQQYFFFSFYFKIRYYQLVMVISLSFFL